VLPFYIEEIMPAQLHNDVRIDDVILDTVEDLPIIYCRFIFNRSLAANHSRLDVALTLAGGWHLGA
jgi:hypothetical protein